MQIINWAICDDAKYLCKSFELAFEGEPDLNLVGAAHDKGSCLQMAGEKKIDVLLLDIQMETPTAGIDLIPELRGIDPDLKIIMLTNYDDEDYVFSAFVNGANDYVQKSLPNQEILRTLRAVFYNRSMLRPEIARKIASKGSKIQEQSKSLMYMVNMMSKLSTSEFEVLKAAYYGESYKQIAASRFVDVSTVRTLASRVLKKFETNSMQHLVQELSKLGIFEFIDHFSIE